MNVVNQGELSVITESLRKAGKKIVLTAGVFDLFHVGHAVYLHDASALGDCLIVGVNSDELVRKLKGLDRPIIKKQYRAKLVTFIRGVCYVTIFNDIELLIRDVNPSILVISSTTDFKRNQEKHRIAAKLNIKVVEFGNSHPDISTSLVIKKIRSP